MADSMNKQELSISVIMPYVNEWPQIAFTIRALREELEGICPFEIVVVDNYCAEIENQSEGIVPDRGHDSYIKNKKRLPFYNINDSVKESATFNIGHLKAQSKVLPWLKHCRFEDKLSHWNAKNIGVLNSTGDLLLFLDAHVVPSHGSIKWQYQTFVENLNQDESFKYNTIHLPLSYHILEQKRLIYKLVWDSVHGVAHYSFTSFKEKSVKPRSIESRLFEVPCMSTCGMMMHRDLFTFLDGWPPGLGIYGGGENFMNFTMAIMGFKKFVSRFGTLHHHGDKRGYSFYWDDYHRNRMIATSIFGGAEMLVRYQESLAGPHNQHTYELMQKAWKVTKTQRELLLPYPKITIDEWAEKWLKEVK